MQMRIECDVETNNENVYSDPLCDTFGYSSRVRTPSSTKQHKCNRQSELV